MGWYLARGDETKEKRQKKYYKRVRVVLKCKLNSRNVINAPNIFPVATVWYGTGMINLSKWEFDNVARQSGKLLNMHRALNPRSSVDRMYRSRAQGGTGLLIVRGSVELERSNFSDMLQTAMREWQKGIRERESNAWSIPERNRGDPNQRRWQRLKVGELKNWEP